MLSVGGVARYGADISGSLTALTSLFPFCPGPLELPVLCHLILEILFQPTGCPGPPCLSLLVIKQPHTDSEHFVTLVTRLTFQMGEA